MKKIIISTIFIFLISGCWNYKELNDYAIATGMAIDYFDDKYIVSILIGNGNILEKQSSESQYESVLYSGSGSTIGEAIMDIDLTLPKQLYLGHLSCLVISEDIAKRGIYDSIKFLLEDSQSKKDFYVVLAKDSKASDVLSITSSLVDNSSESISNSVNFSSRTHGNINAKTFNDVMYDLINEGIDSAINSYIIIGNKEEGNIEPESYIKLDSLGIFRGDKLVGWADKDQGNGINIINNDVNELHFDIPFMDGYIAFNVNNLKTIRDISKNYIKIKTTGVATVSEFTCDINLNNDNIIKELNNSLNEKIKSMIYNGYMLAKNSDSDVFGFGLEYYQNNYLEYEEINFDDIYLNLNPEILVDIKIKDNIKQSEMRIANEN